MEPEQLLTIQSRVATNIINFLKNTKAKKGAAVQTVTYLEARLQLLHKYYNDLFNRQQSLIEHETEYKEDEYFAKRLFEVAESCYVDAVADLSGDIERLRGGGAPAGTEPTRPQARANVEHINVPRVNLPTFSGDPKEWESFKHRFVSLIGSKPAYTDVNKLQYLLSSLRGTAETRLQNLDVTNENFKVAWDLLEKRYGNKRRIFALHLDVLIELKPIRSRNTQDISELLDKVEVTVRALEKLGCDVASYNHWLVHCITRSLDSHTKETWKISQESQADFYQYKDLIEFLEGRMESLDSEKDKRDPRTAGGGSQSASSKFKSQKAATTAHSTGVTSSDFNSSKKYSPCLLCQSDHPLHVCEQFNAKDAKQRYDFCKKSKLCINCLRRAHTAADCKSIHRCSVCNQRHHSKLHFESKPSIRIFSANKDPSSVATSTSEFSSENSTTATLATLERTILLATANILVSDRFGSTLKVRALIDPGSQRSFVTERLLQQLTVTRRPKLVTIFGVGGQVTSRAKGEVTLVIRSPIDHSFQCECSALSMHELTCLLPPRDVPVQDWPHLRGLQLADPNFASSGKVDVILGADVYGLILLNGAVSGPGRFPAAQSTVFGWVLTGPLDSAESFAATTEISVYHSSTEFSLDQALRKFWEIEEIPTSSFQSPEDEYCEQHFLKTFSRNAEGRFVVRLPFSRKERFVDSRDIAVACLIRSEKRRARNSEIQAAYSTFMAEYEHLGHMRIAPPLIDTEAAYFLPHHAVFNATSHKIRVVFNASQKGADGYSLNDLLFTGRKLQADITIVITLWRFFRVVMVTDIEKMFRQFLVHPDDLNWQRLVWREHATLPIRDYQALTVTYGTSCAPFLAMRSLLQLASEGQQSFPLAAQLLKHSTYVDDVYLGNDDESQVRAQRDELINLLSTAGMKLGKWASSTPELLHTSSGEKIVELPTSSGEIVSTLGLKWDTRADSFLFQASLPPITYTVSKRAVLSDTARLFDPLGFIAPVLINAKILLQNLWIMKISWDEPLPDDVLPRWINFRAALSQLSDLRIPRWLGTSRLTEWHLHGFADASQRGYAAVLYAVIPGVSSRILMAKTKVAPVKVQTIPKLELCGAALLVRLAKHLLDGLSQLPLSTNFWSDSKAVLDWLQSHPSRWPTFVANRVSAISTAFPTATWRHVASADNPADCASRGVTVQELASHDLWWEGPRWLIRTEADWPSKQTLVPSHVAALVALDQSEDEFFAYWERFSSFPRIIRVLAYCLRWKTITLQRAQVTAAGLSVRELSHAKLIIFKLVQRQYFSTEIDLLSTGKALSQKQSLVRLTPFIDEDGILRVGGRLQNSSLPYSEKHPIILPGRCRLIRLLVEEAHSITLHGGVQLMKSFLQRNFWIVHGQRLISSVYRTCIRCIRFGARPVQQQMAPLPAARFAQGRPFAITGLDYAGPFPIRFSKGRGAKSSKGYVAIFICLSVKAIHIEVVSDLTTETFMAAYSRFTARRGLCSTLFSDNGTTFKGADKELRQLFRQTSSFVQEVFPQLSNLGTDWKFIPPRAPHFGGLWEAAVRCFKYHLRRVVGDATLTFEEFTTLVVKIEACLNSRPLCPLSSEATDPVALTPGHFLVGTAPLVYPEPLPDLTTKVALGERWKQITQMRDSFWVRWRKEVLSHLQQRAKWLNRKPSLQEGDLVILTDESTPPANWPLAIITKVHPGKDGLVRVVTVRTCKAELVRPVVKVILVPPAEEAEAAFAHHTMTNQL